MKKFISILIITLLFSLITVSSQASYMLETDGSPSYYWTSLSSLKFPIGTLSASGNTITFNPRWDYNSTSTLLYSDSNGYQLGATNNLGISINTSGDATLDPSGGDIHFGADDDICKLAVHDAGYLTIYDDGDDTSVILGPVANGTTTLGLTGSVSVTAGITALGTLTLGADDDTATAAIHDAGTLTLYDDSDDTTVQIGPVTNGSTTLGITGSLDCSGQVDAGTITINSGSITDTSGAVSFGDENVTVLGNIVCGADDDTSTVTIHDAGTITLYDDGDDTSVAIGPVANGGTTLGLTGSLDISGSVDAGTFTVASGSLTDSSGAISFGDENLTTTGTIDLGADDDSSTATIHDAGTLVFYDDSDDTSVTFGPVGDGTTTLGITGGLDVSGNVDAGTMTAASGSLTDSSGAISFSDENLTTTGTLSVGDATATKVSVSDGDGGLYIYRAEAAADIAAAASITIQVNVPAGAKIIGCQLRVDTALTGGELWAAAYETGSTQAIAASQAVAQNTKVNTMFDTNAATDIASAETDVAITKQGGGSFTAAGNIRAIVYYQMFTAMGNAS